MPQSEYCNCCKHNNPNEVSCCETCCTQENKWVKWKNFEPIPEARKFFSYGWTGLDTHEYFWDSRHEDLVPTKAIRISSQIYCPYCAQRMFPIQNQELTVVGYRCLCEAAFAELEYKQAQKELLAKQQDEQAELRSKFAPKLVSNLPQLFELKQRKEKESFDFHHWDRTFFQMDSNLITDVEDLL